MAHETRVVVISQDGLAQDVVSGKHRWRADELAPFGSDTGPSPYELLLASLGTCTSMTLKLYAQRKAFDLQRVTVHLRHSRIHAEDCMDCDTREGFLDHIHREIELEGDLAPEQIARLLEIADKCPVHRTLTSEIKITTSRRAESGN